MSFEQEQEGGPKKAMFEFEQADTEKTMDWMYKGPTALVNREDYLLGRKVDKSFQMLEAAEKGNNSAWLSEAEKDLTPQSILKSTENSGPVDVIRKIKDDPLYQIQKKEQEYRKQLLQNPILMKKLQQQHSGPSSNSNSNSSKPKKKKEKKSKKHKKSRSSSSSSGSSSDEEVNKLFNKLTKSKNFDKILESHHHSPTSKSRPDRTDSLNTIPRRQRHDSSSEDETERNRNKSVSRRESPSPPPPRYNRRHRSRSRSPFLEQRRHEKERYYSSSSSRRRSISPPPYRKRDLRERDEHRDRDRRRDDYDRTKPSLTRAPVEPERNSRAKLDEEEMERRRQEMMGNAKQRDEERQRVVEKHREEIRKEQEILELDRKKNKNATFINKQLAEAANSGSVEQRVKSNSYNIQRSKFAMDKNFARR